jgi:type IV secretion system protein VirD4
MHFDHEEMRFGSARWASEDDMRRAGLSGVEGLPFGFSINGRARNRLRLKSDGHWLIVGGAGSGKCRDILGPVLMRADGARLFVIDPRGELAAISIHNFARWRAHAYCFNPCGLHGLPLHRINPLDILKPCDPRLHADAKFIAEGLIPLSGSAGGQYFELRGRDYVECLMKALVERDGAVSFPSLYRAINAIDADPYLWDALLSFMECSAFPDVRRAAAEMWNKQRESPKEFGAILGTIHANLGFLGDPMLLDALDQPDCSLTDLAGAHQSVSLFVNVPIEYVGIWSPLLRVMFTVTMLYKSRAPSAPRVTMIVDEAGQLGRFEGLLRALTYGRGAGVRVLSVFQDLGQIARNYDAGAVQGFLGSCQLRAFIGTRELQTAQLVSQMAGNETLAFDDPLQQEAARRNRWNAARRYMDGGDPMEAAFDYLHYGEAAQNRTRMQRALITPDEVLSLPEGKMIAFVSGLDLPPMLADKLPYWEQSDLNGYWLPNPFHPPHDRVKLTGAWRGEWRSVVTESVPAHLAHYPQHQSGRVQYVEGHRPW